ncbi:zwei Ig domain protein zig-8-like isoform X1 [Diachasmimorpha longicaudata]|uniref:zwei Ig domain protein zig-8-like isoform X1 n=1 Tax=Diachasmimorpha longicaudata TaxID=58733 RepID=UPI0030B8E5A1
MRGSRIGGLPSATDLELSQMRARIYIVIVAFFVVHPNTSISAPLEDSLVWRERVQDVEVPQDIGELPVFEQTATNVTAFVGQTVYLPCRVRNLGDKVVSWMRSKDLHILTSSEFTFSSDSRFTPEHVPESDAWTLRLLEAKKTDSGGYECQVNTEPKIMYKVELTVRDPDKPEGDDAPYSQQTRISYESTAPVAVIMGPREQHVPSGSTITLRCVITSPYQTRPIRGVQWLRDNKLLTFQAGRGGIIIETERDAGRTVSEATLAAVTKEDVGKYTCRPTEGRADSIALVIEQGEYTEAMQRDAEYVSSGCELNKEHFVLLLFGGIMTLRKF